MATGHTAPQRRERIVALFDAHLAPPTDRAQARTAVADLIHALSGGSRRDLVLTQELYALAVRRRHAHHLRAGGTCPGCAAMMRADLGVTGPSHG